MSALLKYCVFNKNATRILKNEASLPLFFKTHNKLILQFRDHYKFFQDILQLLSYETLIDSYIHLINAQNFPIQQGLIK